MQHSLSIGAISIAFFLACDIGGVAPAAEPLRIEKKAADFSETNYLTEKECEEVKKTGYLKGYGEATYSFEIAEAGWYELYVTAAEWPTDLSLDGRFLMHTPFNSGVWPKKGEAFKVMNLHLTAGKHALKFSRPWHPGLPYMQSFFLEKAPALDGKVRLASLVDRLAFRKGERFPLHLAAGREPQENEIHIRVCEADGAALVADIVKKVSAGGDNFEEDLAAPTDKEGVFELKVVDGAGKPLDRIIEYVVVDTRTRPSSGEMSKETVATIDCVKQAPDFSSGETKVVQSAAGTYRETGPKGVDHHAHNADFFGYQVALPSGDAPYLVEVDYPDDDDRTMTFSALMPVSYSIGVGVACGGPYSLSNRIQTHEFLVWPSEKQLLIDIRNQHAGKKAAVSRIQVSRLRGNWPPLQEKGGARRFGPYYEEPLRYTLCFGAQPVGNTWANVWKPTQRWAEWSAHVGANLWLPTVAVYQATLWPSRLIPDFQTDDEAGYGLKGPFTLKEPFAKDLLRLMLLAGEKYGIEVVGEVFHLTAGLSTRMLDARFGGKGTTEDDGPHKSWLIVSKDGKAGGGWNPIHPGLQDYVAGIFTEIAQRYKDSPAFKGLAIRFMGWCYPSWQAFPSITWGYGDSTVELFEKETGVKVPVKGDDSERCQKRYAWLMANAYEKWVNWRCQKIGQFHQRLARILTDARPDLKLYLNVYGPTWFLSEGEGAAAIRAQDEKGWLKLIKETGVDPAFYRGEPGIVLSDSRAYPPGIRTGQAWLAAAEQDRHYDPQPIRASEHPADGGTVSAVRFGYEYLETEIPTKPYAVKFSGGVLGGKDTFFVSAVLEPAGRHALDRYANALAEGNITFMSDGGNVYVLGQPRYLREFMAEYRALPSIGMKLHEASGDPVALWFGEQGNQFSFYLVNRADYPVNVRLQLAGGAGGIQRLATGKPLELAKDGALQLALEPYQLIALGGAKGLTIAGMEIRVPDAVPKELQSQMELAGKLVNGEVETRTVLAFSRGDLMAAQKKLAEARQYFDKKQFWSVRRALMSHQLVRIYQGFGVFPPGLFHKKQTENINSATGG